MIITEIPTNKMDVLEAFKSIVWPIADAEHYGDKQPDFDKKEFTLVAKEGEAIVGYISAIIDCANHSSKSYRRIRVCVNG